MKVVSCVRKIGNPDIPVVKIIVGGGVTEFRLALSASLATFLAVLVYF